MAGRGKKGLEDVAAMMAGATVVAFPSGDAAGAGDPGPGANDQVGGDRDGGPAIHPSEQLPDDCPVIPLGTVNGLYFYLDELNQLREVKAKEHEKGTIESLFGRRPRLCDLTWPRYGAKKDPETGEAMITGWRPEQAARALRAACARKGVWSAVGKVRARGAHAGDDGALILHSGDVVWIQDRWQRPGLIDGLVYPAAEAVPRPWHEPVGREPGEELFAVLGTWNWQRGPGETGEPSIDATLALGWIAAALVCGALGWRPSAWLTGGRGTGKSTLQKWIELLLGSGLLHATDVTEAWVRQTLKMQTLPVALDEQEAEADERRMAALIKLARLAASGAPLGRGGADHQAHDFTMRSSFLFSSVLVPAMTPADRSRLAMLELKPLEGGDAPTIDVAAIAQLGRKLRRRMLDQWPRLAETIRLYRLSLGDWGHDARMQDQFGTMLGCADCLLYDHLPRFDMLNGWGERLDARHLAEKLDDMDEGELCARYLATSPLQGVSGAEPETLAMWIAKAMSPTEELSQRGQRRLETVGLLVMEVHWVEDEKGALKMRKRRMRGGEPRPDAVVMVAVAENHRALDALLRDERWKRGVWTQALRRIPGAERRVKVHVGGRKEWATLVPATAFLGDGDDDGDEDGA